MLHILKTLLVKYDWSSYFLSFFSLFLKREETRTRKFWSRTKKASLIDLKRSKEIDYVEDFDVRDKL